MTFPATFKLGNLAGKAEADSVNLEPKPQSRAAKASAIQAIQANLRAEAKAKNDKKAK